jgi:hypothetical protein
MQAFFETNLVVLDVNGIRCVRDAAGRVQQLTGMIFPSVEAFAAHVLAGRSPSDTVDSASSEAPAHSPERLAKRARSASSS